MSRRNYRHDVQGRVLGIPYDFRLPNASKIASRIANPRAKMMTPKVWGLGWTLNLAHPGSWYLIGGLMLFAIVSALVFVLIGLVVFVVAFRATVKSTLAAFREEILEKQNVALALLVGMLALSVALIVAAAVH